MKRQRTNHHTVSLEGLAPVLATVLIGALLVSMIVGFTSGLIAGFKLTGREGEKAEKTTDNNIPVETTENRTEPTSKPETEPTTAPLFEGVAEARMYAFELTPAERQIVENIVMGEAEGESYNGKVLVAQCILNACLKDDIQPSEVRSKYKYSGWKENPTDDVKKAVSAVFDDGYKITDEAILYFYAPKYTQSKWHETQRYILTEGGHKFFAEWEM